MLKRFFTVLSFLAICSCALAMIQAQTPARTMPANLLIREERRIIVNGVSEIWRLQWKAPPQPACEETAFEDSSTCPCSGFAYGEAGDLTLVRIAKGREIDRLELTPLFKETGDRGAIVQRWNFQLEDFEWSKAADFAERVRLRPIVAIMNLVDYNHDGQSTEFLLRTMNLACGKSFGVVIGLTPRRPRLHAFGTLLHPDKPLELQQWEWEALRKATGAIEVDDWKCGDHGSETFTSARLSALSGRIEVVYREFTCTDFGKRGRLIHESPR